MSDVWQALDVTVAPRCRLSGKPPCAAPLFSLLPLSQPLGSPTAEQHVKLYLTCTHTHTWVSICKKKYLQKIPGSIYTGTLFNCVVKTVLSKPNELVEQNDGQNVVWRDDAMPEKIQFLCCLPFINVNLLSLHQCYRELNKNRAGCLVLVIPSLMMNGSWRNSRTSKLPRLATFDTDCFQTTYNEFYTLHRTSLQLLCLACMWLYHSWNDGNKYLYNLKWNTACSRVFFVFYMFDIFHGEIRE